MKSMSLHSFYTLYGLICCRDRQAVSFPFFIRCRDACPALVLRRSIVASITETLKLNRRSLRLTGRCVSLKDTPEHSVLATSPLKLIGTHVCPHIPFFLKCSRCSESAYALVLEPLSSLEDTTPGMARTDKIPVDICTDASMPTTDLKCVSARDCRFIG